MSGRISIITKISRDFSDQLNTFENLMFLGYLTRAYPFHPPFINSSSLIENVLWAVHWAHLMFKN